jgi:hypothetical protein
LGSPSYAAETWTTTKNDERRLSSRGKSFAGYMVQYVREGSDGRDAVEN